MREVRVKASRDYSVYISSGGEGFSFLLDTNKIKKIFVVTDEKVKGAQEKFLKVIEDRCLGISVIKPGEDSKSLETVTSIYDKLISCNADRKTAVVAFGGGVVGDIAGFAASTYMRGLPLVQVPTTLMAQCDSSIGGKNGVNFGGIKNIIGQFYQPVFVYSDVNFLKTLDRRDFLSGMAEIIKYGFVCDSNLFHFLEENKTGIKEREMDRLLHIVNETSKIKALIVEEDELDTGMRQVLNFGHTIGHGIEAMAGFKILHGEAVSLGMVAESLIALENQLISEREYERLVRLLEYFELPIAMSGVDVEQLIHLISHDKKKTSNNLKFALPDKLGHAIITSEIKQNMIRESIDGIIRR